jgi:radical SAM protein with 4Fe4S-binding SPASM domain
LLRQISYKEFSLATHVSNLELGRPNTCQLELTYACGLRCLYCYAGNYNRPECIGRELNTAMVKKVIDELKSIGVLWLCFTGGDPLTRPDFCELYSYARGQGFLITVFTSGYSLCQEHLSLFKREPPFSIEITLNAVEEALYEKISGVKSSFNKAMAAINALRRIKLPLKLKTTVTKLNLHHLGEIKRYLRKIGLKYDADYFLNSGFDNDKRPLAFQVPLAAIPSRFKTGENTHGCAPRKKTSNPNPLFICTVGAGDSFLLDPYGNISLCFSIRAPRINVLETGVAAGYRNLVKYFNGLDFKTDSECKTCRRREVCWWCPGKAFVETGSLEKPIDYFCRIAKANEN